MDGAGLSGWARYHNVCLQQTNAGGFCVISHIRNKMTPPLIYRFSVTGYRISACRRDAGFGVFWNTLGVRRIDRIVVRVVG